MVKKILIGLASILGAVVLLAGGYVLYLQLEYDRIEDNLVMEIANQQTSMLSSNKSYTLATYNIGFGAYSDDYTFFMDTGIMADGVETKGTSGKAASKDEVERNIQGSMNIMKELNADFYFLQEVDEKADRSYDVNQRKAVEENLPFHSNSFAYNFHSGYLMLPPSDPHGASDAGMMTLSNHQAHSATRHSFTVDESFITKFTDLDRCFTSTIVPVENGKNLVLINVHMSAYDEGGLIRAQQLAQLNMILEAEKEKGNYVIVGGDFNHNLGGELETFPSTQQVPNWIAVLKEEDLPTGYELVLAENSQDVATCRGADIPYEKGVTYETIVDGFIVSENVKATSQNIDGGYAYSDHNPVVLTFELQ